MNALQWFRLAALAVMFCTVSACERQMADMYDQPKLRPLEESSVWPDRRAARPVPDNTIPYSSGPFSDPTSGRQDVLPLPLDIPSALPVDAHGAPEIAANPAPGSAAQLQNPLPVTIELLQRGQERFDIFCAPCHGYGGDGDGMVVRRGFPKPPSYHTSGLRQAPDSHLFEVITHGYGAMYPYAERVPIDDRWAIVAYIRALQLSQNAPLDAVPAAERSALERAGAPVERAP
jgi:mono/diheme cytochrome c family protein